MDDTDFQLALAASTVRYIVDTVKEEGKGPGHALQALENIVVGIVMVAAHEAEWESVARELGKNVQERLLKMRQMKAKGLN